MRQRLVMALMVGGLAQATWAESRPIERLPKDVVRWSTVWIEIPKAMMGVGQAYGPVAALVWGPVKGTAMMVDSATKELWQASKPDKRPGHRSTAKRPAGPLFQYEF